MVVKLSIFNKTEKYRLNSQIRSELSGDFLELSDGFVHYEILGKADKHPVVLIHGFSTPYFIWDKTALPLASSGFQVLRYDLYGRGYSDRLNLSYNLDLFERQLFELLLGLGMSTPVDLIGLSMGGDIAVHFTKKNPSIVRKLCLIDPACLFFKNSCLTRLLNIPIVGDIFMYLHGDALILSSLYDDFYEPEHFPEYKEKFIEQMKYKGFKQAILSTQRSLFSESFSNLYTTSLNEYNQSILLIWGREDITIPFDMNKKVRDIMPKVEFHVIDKARHVPHYEKPDLVNPIIISFLEK